MKKVKIVFKENNTPVIRTTTTKKQFTGNIHAVSSFGKDNVVIKFYDGKISVKENCVVIREHENNNILAIFPLHSLIFAEIVETEDQ